MPIKKGHIFFNAGNRRQKMAISSSIGRYNSGGKIGQSNAEKLPAIKLINLLSIVGGTSNV
jgi:hypothetical protein